MSGSARRTTRQPASAASKYFSRSARKPGGAIVPASAGEEDAALDLDERAGLDVREVCAPFALAVKDELAFHLRAAESAPVECEFRFEA